MSFEHVCLFRVSLFLFNSSSTKYEEYGSVGCTVVGHSQDSRYKIGCYNEKSEYICTANITPNNESGTLLSVEGPYVSFKDDTGKIWSLQFESTETAVEFCSNVAIAMYRTAGAPKDSLLVCDVAKGTPQKTVFFGHRVKVLFQCWVVNNPKGSSLISLGSALYDADATSVVVTVPPNHLGVTERMFGFEGMLIGMNEGGRRLVVIPQSMKRGHGPSVDVCFYVQVVKLLAENSCDEGDCKNEDDRRLGQQCRIEGSPRTSVEGFSRDQFLLVDRLRDQVFSLTEQLRNARDQINCLSRNVRSHEHQRSAVGLANAQIEYTIRKMIDDSEKQRGLLVEKKKKIEALKDTNNVLAERLEKLLNTTRLLSDEKANSISNKSEEKLELDRQVLQVQSHLNMLQTEQEDILRHIASVKKLINTNSRDIKIEQNQLQVSLVSFRTNESKLSALQKSHQEELERCKILDGMTNTQRCEVQRLQSDMHSAEEQLASCCRKMESDSLYFSRILDEDRDKAASELREIQDELVADLAALKGRYQEERHRAVEAAFERGRRQGMMQGRSDTFTEGDLRAQELFLTTQRCRAETEVIEVRLRAAKEERDIDTRSMETEISLMAEKAAALNEEVGLTEAKVHASEVKCDSLIRKMNSRLEMLLSAVPGEVTQRTLLDVIDAVEFGRDVDCSSAQREAQLEKQRIAAELGSVVAWVRATLYNQSGICPPLRLPYEGRVVPPLSVSATVTEKRPDERAEQLLSTQPTDKVFRDPSTQSTQQHPSTAPSSSGPFPLPHIRPLGNFAPPARGG